MFATIASSDHILRSVFLPGGRTSYNWSYEWSRDQQRLEKWPPTIDRMINSVGRRMGSDLNPRNISTFYSVSEQPIGGTTGRNVARPVSRLNVRPLMIWNSRFQVLNMTTALLRLICPLRSPATSATSRTTYATSRTFFLRLAHFSVAGRS